MSLRIPKYRLHKSTGQALVQIDGRRIYLGKHGTEQSQQQYRRLIAEWMADGQHLRGLVQAHEAGPTISELIVSYQTFAGG